jgi:putative copper export protein
MNANRVMLRVLFVCLVGEIISLITLFNRPSVANVRTVDVVHLLATGAWLGATLVALVGFFVGRARAPE